jgi:mannose-6-phosphate isomerase-like protein (cupin superfamily)
MPVFQSGPGLAPAWCEMTVFEIIALPAGQRGQWGRTAPKEKLIIVQGDCRIKVGAEEILTTRGTILDLPSGNAGFEVLETTSGATLVRMCGHWGNELGGSGIFKVSSSVERGDRGDPVSYPKSTNFDSHYHDCDEYWILFQGRGTAVSEGGSYEVGPGDCVGTRMGHHHDFPTVIEPVQAVYFETTLKGRKRLGHLWEHTHGPAQPPEDQA